MIESVFTPLFYGYVVVMIIGAALINRVRGGWLEELGYAWADKLQVKRILTAAWLTVPIIVAQHPLEIAILYLTLMWAAFIPGWGEYLIAQPKLTAVRWG